MIKTSSCLLLLSDYTLHYCCFYFYIFAMASTAQFYFSSYKKNTWKLSYLYNGYTYYRNTTIKGVEYYKCDERSICQATYIKTGDDLKPGRKYWARGVHSSHKPDFDKSQAELLRGRTKMIQNFHRKSSCCPRWHSFRVET
jgi:hypothetical protein